MKKNILAFSVLALILFSCTNESGGNKNIIPAESQNEAQSNEMSTPPSKVSSLNKSLQWTAYKTEGKVAVNGTFNDISLSDVKESDKLTDALNGAKFSCDATTVSTGDTSRDGTLTVFFFKRLSSTNITGSFGSFADNKVPVTINMNGKNITKDFAYSLEGNDITIKGSIDLIKDFAADNAFNSLHKACFDLHEGKTWTDVDLTVKISK